MFCNQCGTQVDDGAAFCAKCGARVMDGAAQNQTQMGGWQTQAQPGMGAMEAPKKKKSKKLPIILGTIAAIAVVIFIALNWSKIDYVATVRAHTPFADSIGISYTCGEVYDKYIPDAKWSVRKSDNTSSYVDISGIIKGTDEKITVTIKVSEDEQNPNRVFFSPTSVVVDGEELSNQEDTANFLGMLFVAYDENYDDLSGLLYFTESTKEMREKIRLSETYTDAEMGISFQYPATWKLMSADEFAGDDEIVESNIESTTFGLRDLVENISIEVSKYTNVPEEWVSSIFLGDEELLASEWNSSDVSASITELDGIPAMIISHIAEDGFIFQNYYYMIDSDFYTIIFKIKPSRLGNRKKVLEAYADAIMDTYSIDVPDDFSLDSTSQEDTYGYGYEDDVPYGYEDSYLDYQAWGGVYVDGWLDTTLRLSLYSDGSQDPGCGYLTASFRGMEATGKLYFLGDGTFQWERGGYGGNNVNATYYVLAINNGGTYQLELYDANFEYEVTFTQYEQYIP